MQLALFAISYKPILVSAWANVVINDEMKLEVLNFERQMSNKFQILKQNAIKILRILHITHPNPNKNKYSKELDVWLVNTENTDKIYVELYNDKLHFNTYMEVIPH